MRALLVDAGNTRVSCVAWTATSRLPALDPDSPTGLARAHPLDEVADLATPHTADEEEIFAADFARVMGRVGHSPVVLVTTVPRIVPLMERVGQVRIADHRCPLPFAHRLEDLAATGADRLCNVAAAVAAGLDSVCIVDAGTATTVDVLRDGVYLGGVIAPGMAFAQRRLGEAAARLAPLPFTFAPLAPATDTEGAMTAGGYHAGVGGVEALLAGLASGAGSLPVVVTGGLGQHLAGEGRHHDPHWCARGAMVLTTDP